MSNEYSARKRTFLLVGSLLAKESIIAKIKEIADRVGASEGIETVEVELLGGGKARMLRIVIDKSSGVTHADCEFMSQQVGTILDVEDVIPGGSYHLEVSSPGVERKLTKLSDFQRFIGKKAKVVLSEPVENQTSWIGKLASVEGDLVTLEPSEGKTVRFGFEQVRKANLKFE